MLPSLILLLSVIVLTVLYITLQTVTNRRRVRQLLKNLPKFKPIPSIPLLGSLHLFKDRSPNGIHRTFVDFHRQYGKNLVLQELSNDFKLLTSDPKVIEQVMQAKTIIKPNLYNALVPWVGFGSINASGHRWSMLRKVVRPAFSYKMLDGFLATMQRQADILVAKFATHVGAPDFDVYDPVKYCAMDIICETTMDLDLGSQSNPTEPFMKATEEELSLAYKRMFSSMFMNDFIYACTTASRRSQSLKQIMHGFANSVIRNRKERLAEPSICYRNDDTETCKMSLLDLLLNSQFDGRPMSIDDIRGEVNTFIAAGQETVTSTISFILYYLSRDTLIQQRVYDEIVAVFGSHGVRSDRLTLGSLQELKYMEMVIKETLRFTPTVPMIGRQSAGDMVIDGVPIPAGTDVLINIYILQNDPNYFPEPDRFLPERFAEDGAEKLTPFSYMPFSFGARMCIGQRFAMLEMKTVLVKLLTRYRFLPCEEQNVLQLKTDLTLKPSRGAFVKILER